MIICFKSLTQFINIFGILNYVLDDTVLKIMWTTTKKNVNKNNAKQLRRKCQGCSSWQFIVHVGEGNNKKTVLFIYFTFEYSSLTEFNLKYSHNVDSVN